MVLAGTLTSRNALPSTTRAFVGSEPMMGELPKRTDVAPVAVAYSRTRLPLGRITRFVDDVLPSRPTVNDHAEGASITRL